MHSHRHFQGFNWQNTILALFCDTFLQQHVPKSQTIAIHWLYQIMSKLIANITNSQPQPPPNNPAIYTKPQNKPYHWYTAHALLVVLPRSVWMLSYSASRANVVRVLIALSRANEAVNVVRPCRSGRQKSVCRGEIGDIDDDQVLS